MFNLFGFTPGSLSDEELLQKQTDLHARIVWASRFGSGGMVTQLQALLSAVELERQERAFRMPWSERQAMFPDVIETDPDLAMQGKEAEKPEKGKIVPQQRPRVTITRTEKPV